MRKPPKPRTILSVARMEDYEISCESKPSTSSTKTTKASHHKSDHNYVTKDSPHSLKRKLDSAIQHAEIIKKRLKYTNAKVRRLKRKVKSLSEIVTSRKKNDMISTGCENLLRSSFSGVSLAVMERIMRQKSGKLTACVVPR